MKPVVIEKKLDDDLTKKPLLPDDEKKKEDKEKERKARREKRKAEREKQEVTRSLDMDEGLETARVINGLTPVKPTWVGNEVAKSFFEKNSDVDKLKNEFSYLNSIDCSKPATFFHNYIERNRNQTGSILVQQYPVLDENRVVLNRPGPDQINYINASFVTLKDVPNKIIVAQLPQMENESFVEDFWQMIYQENITIVYLLCTQDEIKKAPTKLFCEEVGAFQYIGKMFINNRKAETFPDLQFHTIEVLPEGCSDAVMTKVHQVLTWEKARQPIKLRLIIKMIHSFLSEKEVQNAGICVVSLWGSGRACSFLAALIAISLLNKGIEPKILDIMTSIKLYKSFKRKSLNS
ncbi:unnamed protein product [Caenorhabditis bovis]|uniref:Tyrosine-protein phosphatase domain-containing protein n=1 Tax=Caenorhabditis bovis TaxID=2654633 RepID=A0A8S1EV71_9PELO|nr:unnamed protein product [Caenorhabditis bovis]